MTDKSLRPDAPSSARQLAREIVDAQKGWTTERDHSYDANHLILANALLSEPVAWMYHICDDGLNDITQSKKTVAGWPDKSRIVPLYAAPLVEAVQGGWISVHEAVPVAGTDVLISGFNHGKEDGDRWYMIAQRGVNHEFGDWWTDLDYPSAVYAPTHWLEIPHVPYMKQEPEGHGTTGGEKDG